MWEQSGAWKNTIKYTGPKLSSNKTKLLETQMWITDFSSVTSISLLGSNLVFHYIVNSSANNTQTTGSSVNHKEFQKIGMIVYLNLFLYSENVLDNSIIFLAS